MGREKTQDFISGSQNLQFILHVAGEGEEEAGGRGESGGKAAAWERRGGCSWKFSWDPKLWALKKEEGVGLGSDCFGETWKNFFWAGGGGG